MLGQEIAHTQRAHAPLRAEFLERLPRFTGTPVERGGPMQHVHVDIIELQQAKLAVERLACAVIPLLGIAQFRRNPQVFALLTFRESRIVQRATHAGLIVVPRRAVDMTVAGFQRTLHYGGNALIVDTQHAQADLRNQIAVVQCDHGGMEGCHALSFRRLCFRRLFSTVLMLVPA